MFVALLRSMGKTDELKELYSPPTSTSNVTWYVYIELLPKLFKMRSEGKLRQNQTKEIIFVMDNMKYKYTGEVDEDGKACGFGKAITDKLTVAGTFFNDNPEGVLIFTREVLKSLSIVRIRDLLLKIARSLSKVFTISQ